MHGYFNYHSIDDEKRKLRIHVHTLKRSFDIQKRKQEYAQRQAKEWKKKYKDLEKITDQLKKENEEIKRQRDTYQNMLFKKNIQHDNRGEEAALLTKPSVKTRGGQKGHKGYGRAIPETIHFYKHLHMKKCPDCDTKLKRSTTISTHTVEDIPPETAIKPVVTQYIVERQWCRTCKKEVTAKPTGIIPGSRLGINLIISIMILKYGARASLDIIVFLLKHQYGLTVSKGGIIYILHQTKQWLGPQYQKLKEEIRGSPIVYADETGWRVKGINTWIWAFLSKDTVTYQVEESRGSGVPRDFFKDGNPHAILVRDDYAAYQKIPLTQQSCWAHLLRKSHEAVDREESSEEMKEIHTKLKALYESLLNKTDTPFQKQKRQKIYERLCGRLQHIINTPFLSADAKRIQIRLNNQNKNLLTALLYEGVPLTNNHAERNIRPLVVTRKISGGSQSPAGAYTHMVNMSIFQTIKLKQQPLIPTLKEQLLHGVFGEN